MSKAVIRNYVPSVVDFTFYIEFNLSTAAPQVQAPLLLGPLKLLLCLPVSPPAPFQCVAGMSYSKFSPDPDHATPCLKPFHTLFSGWTRSSPYLTHTWGYHIKYRVPSQMWISENMLFSINISRAITHCLSEIIRHPIFLFAKSGYVTTRALQNLTPSTLSWLISHQMSLVLWLKLYCFSSEPGVGCAPLTSGPLHMQFSLLGMPVASPTAATHLSDPGLHWIAFFSLCYVLSAWCHLPSLTLN